MEHPMHFRFLAGVLAAGGIFWGFLCSVFMFHNLATLIFIPGYIITVGYIVRCCYTPRLLWRRVIWGTSAVVQGAWLISIMGICIFSVYSDLRHAGDVEDDVLPIIFDSLWWAFAFGISIYGFWFDKRQISSHD
jgi:hypothetical protein